MAKMNYRWLAQKDLMRRHGTESLKQASRREEAEILLAYVKKPYKPNKWREVGKRWRRDENR